MKIQLKTIGCEIEASPGNRLGHVDPALVISLLREEGWVFFSGFAPSLEEFVAFTDRFGRCAGPRHVHYPEGGEALGFHAEDAYNPYRPDTIWFLCRYEGSDGGAPTGVVDGVRLLSDLSPKWRSFCQDHHLRFDRHWAPSTWQRAVGGDRAAEVAEVLDGLPSFSYRFLPDGTLYTCYEAPMVVRTFAGAESFSNTLLQAVTEQSFYGMSLADGSPVPSSLVDHVHQLALDQELALGWSSGDVAVIDNYRMMHRRAEYHGQDRDLRARHCENLFGSELPDDSSQLAAAVKSLIQSDEGSPVNVGPLLAMV
jgi:hypothetical protein